MDAIEIGVGYAVVRLTDRELVLLANAINETQEALEEREFQTRTGAELEEPTCCEEPSRRPLQRCVIKDDCRCVRTRMETVTELCDARPSRYPRSDVELKLFADGLSIVVANHSPFETAETDAQAVVTHRFDSDLVTSRHSVEVVDSTGTSCRCVLAAGGGASTVHDRSALLHDRCLIVAVGRYVCALSLPTLDLLWSVVVDDSTSFGVYHSAKHDCYISHGELAIARVALDGAIVWSAAGKDVFSEGFTLHDDYAEVVDFNHERYRFDLATGGLLRRG